MTRTEVEMMWCHCVNAATKYARRIGVKNLSDHDHHNLFAALDRAIEGEWLRARGKETLHR
jgi:hypothetical protein